MRVRISMELLDDYYRPVETLAPVDALFDAAITDHTVSTAQKLVAEALERHTRVNKTFDGLQHFSGRS